MSNCGIGLQVIRTTCTHRVEGKTLCGRKLRMVWLRGRWSMARNTIHHPSCPEAVREQKPTLTIKQELTRNQDGQRSGATG